MVFRLILNWKKCCEKHSGKRSWQHCRCFLRKNPSNMCVWICFQRDKHSPVNILRCVVISTKKHPPTYLFSEPCKFSLVNSAMLQLNLNSTWAMDLLWSSLFLILFNYLYCLLRYMFSYNHPTYSDFDLVLKQICRRSHEMTLCAQITMKKVASPRKQIRSNHLLPLS